MPESDVMIESVVSEPFAEVSYIAWRRGGSEAVVVDPGFDTGTILDTYRSATAAIGGHVSTSVATTSRFPGSGPITFGDGKQGQGGYRLAFTIRRG